MNPFRYEQYTYSHDPVTIAGTIGATASATINIDGASLFVWDKTGLFCTIAQALQTAATRVLPNVSVMMIDTGANKPLMLKPVPLPVITGSGEIPFLLPREYPFRKTANIQITYTNLCATAYNDLSIYFIGSRIFGLEFEELEQWLKKKQLREIQ